MPDGHIDEGFGHEEKVWVYQGMDTAV